MIVGLFVGGKSSRMGRAKGLLPAPDTGEPLVVRSVRIAREAGFVPLLIGDATPYESLVPDVERVPDASIGEGPLAGLLSLARRADPFALALACDMPFVDAATLRAIADHPSSAKALVPKRGAFFEPFLARYASAIVPDIEQALAAGTRSIQALLASVDADVLAIDPRLLTDWDTPDDVSPRR